MSRDQRQSRRNRNARPRSKAVMLRRLFAGLSALAASLVTSCDEAPVSSVLYSSGRVQAWLNSVTARGPLLVETVNNPFDVGQLWMGETIAGLVRQSVTHRVIQTTSDPLKAYEPSIRIRVAFHTPREYDPRQLCQGVLPAVSPVPERLTLLAVFCHKDELESAVWGTIRQPAEPSDPALGRLVKQVAVQMFDDSLARR